jgi:hypothetical protein
MASSATLALKSAPCRLRCIFLLISVWLLNCWAATLSYFPVQFPGYIIDVQVAKQRGEELGLEPYELAFYDALAQNDSARDVMGQDKLRELAIALVVRVRQNASIDWNLKESVRARMKVMVKRLLRQYGYPPDMQALAIELVLEQAKVFTEFEVENATP